MDRFLEPKPSYHLPILLPLDEPTEEGYLTAYIAAQRVGKRPFVAQNVHEALRAKVIVLIHTHWTLSQEEIMHLHQ